MKQKNRKQLFKRIAMLVLCLFVSLVVILSFYPNGKGRVGLNLTVHRAGACIGIWLPTTTVLNYFPNGEFKFGSFSYEVNDVTHAYWVDGYCLGKDVYVEE